MIFRAGDSACIPWIPGSEKDANTSSRTSLAIPQTRSVRVYRQHTWRISFFVNNLRLHLLRLRFVYHLPSRVELNIWVEAVFSTRWQRASPRLIDVPVCVSCSVCRANDQARCGTIDHIQLVFLLWWQQYVRKIAILVPTLRNKCFSFGPGTELLVLWSSNSLYLLLRQTPVEIDSRYFANLYAIKLRFTRLLCL
jgi:hypothetical protein